MSAKELAATLVLELPIVDGGWTVKVRTGPPAPPDEPDEPDEQVTVWTGVVPLRLVAGAVEPSRWCPPGVPVPDSVRRLVERHR
jgi:hypothetical protein